MNGAKAAERDAAELSNRLAAIVASSDDAIISKSLDGVIVTWNEGATRIFGWQPEEVIGRSITILIPADRLEEEPAILARIRAGQRVDHYQTVRVRKDGSFVDISLSISPVRNAAGEIVGASKIARDITQQKRAEQALRVSNERFRLMADSAPVLIWMADHTKARNWFNKSWLDFTGRTPDQEAGFGWTQNVHEDDLARCLQAYAEGFDTREPFGSEYRLRRADGQPRWIIERASPLFEGPAHSFSGYIGSCVDITESKQLQADREETLKAERAAREEAERVGRLKDEFLATVSHELRTPLNAILGWSTLMRRLDPGSDDHKRGLETIERNARVQGEIIADLLDMSRIISGKVQLDVQSIDLAEVINAALDAVKLSIEAKKLRLRVTLDARAGRLRGDPGRLQQVIWNLLTNAVKFTPSGGRIDVVMERVNSHVEVCVEDSGVGIKPEFLAFVFDRFRQADSSTTRRHGGLGLGLSIVKHLVELHGGSVRVKSAGEGQGSTFIVALPISVMRIEESSRVERPAFSDVDVSTIELPSLAGVRALVVDDQEDARILICRLIEENGGRCVLAESSAQALTLIGQEDVNILISDIGMPDFDGYELIRKVRALHSSQLRNLPAIALTAYARADDRQRALLAGFQMHVSKPVEPRELIAGIASLLNLSAPPQAD
ncbi:MAG TPA: PAS domain S-box protein [Steroidobacteraceae bacterium]|nr:PAS domain S-box protein [Steroidobacteraceae bacterium]